MRTRGKRWVAVAATTMIAGAVAPTMARWLRRTGAARRSIDMLMTVVVERPIGEVFEFCRDFENFPRITDLLLSVEDSQDGRSHWSVRSPSGRTVGWDAVVTKYVPNSVIAWESVPGSEVAATGVMRFAPLSERETRVDLRLTYRPLRTDFLEALRALMNPSNTRQLRSELTQASRDLTPPAPLGSDQEVRSSATSDLPFDAPRDDAPRSPPQEGGHQPVAPPEAGRLVDQGISP